MQVTLTVPDSMVAKVRGQSVTRDMTQLPKAAQLVIFEYGFQRINNDAGAVGKDESTDAAVAKSDKKWAALVSGDIRVKSARETDPVRRRAIELALEKVKAALEAKGVKLADVDGRDLRKKAISVIDGPNGQAFLDEAKKQLDQAAALDIDIDLGDLGQEADEDEEDDPE